MRGRELTLAIPSGILARMLRAYFDTNVYLALADRDPRTPPEDEAALMGAIKAGVLSAPVSLAAIEEAMGQFETNRSGMIGKLAVIRRLEGFRGMLKQPRDILSDAIEAYAAGVGAPPVTLPEDERKPIVSFLADVIAGSRKHDDDLKAIVEGVGGRDRGMKGAWVTDMLKAKDGVLADPVMPSLKERRKVPFEQFIDGVGRDLAEGFAEKLGCGAACRGRGLDGLVMVPAVRLCVGVSTSQMYAQVIGTPGSRDLRRPDSGDGYDVWHAILASTADVFVTLDGRLADHVEIIPSVGIRVVRSIKDLLTLL